MRYPKLFVAAVLALSATAITFSAAPQGLDQPRESFTAVAVANSDMASGIARLLIDVKRWSTDGERERLIGLLREKGQSAMLAQLRDSPSTGTIRTQESLAYDLRFAYQEPGKEGGRQIMLITDRPVSFGEAWAQPRSIEYPFTVIQMQMDGDGRGKGTLSYATRIEASGKFIFLEDLATAPIQLTEITAEKREN